jgi:hypothetical protein
MNPKILAPEWGHNGDILIPNSIASPTGETAHKWLKRPIEPQPEPVKPNTRMGHVWDIWGIPQALDYHNKRTVPGK